MTDTDRPIRVAHVLHHLALGGLETQVLRMVTASADYPIEYTICYFGDDESLRSDFEAAGATVVHLDTGSTSLAAQFHPKRLAAVARFFEEQRFDVIHAHVSLYVLVVARICGRLADIPVIGTYHNTRENYHATMQVAERLTRPLSVANFAVSQSVERTYATTSSVYTIGDKPGFDRSTYTIYNGIDVDAFDDVTETVTASELRATLGLDDGPVYLTIGRYSPEKNQSSLIQAMTTVVEQHPTAHLVIVGWGPLESELRETARSLGLESNVTVTGRVPTVQEYYELADVFVLPSLTEGLSVVLLEAMAAGLPVVGTDAPGTAELVVDGETGIVVPLDDTSALTDAMVQIASMDRAHLGSAGRQRVESAFDIDHMITAYADVYRRLADRRVPQRLIESTT